MNRLPALLVLVLLPAAAACAGEAVLPFGGVKAETIPERKELPPVEEKGKPYKVPATNWEKRPILWGWTCELADGTGLSFGGVHQTADDGRPHTAVLAGGMWTNLAEELRKKNPLQKHHAAARALRVGIKDALALARHLYFEGKPAGEEAKLLAAGADPAVAKAAADLAKLTGELKAAKDLPPYEAGQVQAALKHLEAAAAGLKPFAPRVTPEAMAALRSAQIEVERAAEPLDAEPAGRALSRIAYDAKSKLYVLFGGTHMDYETNDLWVFDPAQRKWLQRHQDAAPEPRCDHFLEAPGDGRIVLYGGCAYIPGKHYVNVGPAKWIYDVAKNAWSPDGHQEAAVASGTRSARYFPPAGPEAFMKGERPDAAAHEAELQKLPANTWTLLKTPIPLGGRDWGTWVHDPDRDMLYVWAGGHASYAGNDVARYHLATGRWEISDPIELPLGCCGTNEQYPSGVNFNGRPWVKKHVWNSQAYDGVLKQMIMGGANDAKLDPYCYFYDPDKAEWTGRLRLPEGMPNDAYGMQIRHTAHGMFAWAGAWLFDDKAKAWSQLKVQGQMPGGGVDSSGLVYDAKRGRVLLATLGGYAKPFDGQLYALDLKTLQVAPLNPDGMQDPARKWSIFLREVICLPESDLFLWPQRLNLDGKEADDRYVAYDAVKNRWVTVKLATAVGAPKFNTQYSPVCSGIAWDAKRKLVWVGLATWDGGVWVLRFDPATADIQPLAK